MLRSFFSGLYHQFMASRLRAEMPADADLIENIVKKNASLQPSPQKQRRPFRKPFRLGQLAHHGRLDVPRVGTL